MDLTQSKVLIVDDTKENIDVLAELLGEEYDVSIALDGKSALELVEDEKPDLILLDVMMPQMNGYEVCMHLKNEEKTKNIPVIFLTALNRSENEEKGLNIGAVDYIIKPFNPDIVKMRVRNQVLLKMHQDNLEYLIEERTRELELTQEVIIKSMGIIAEFRDPETGAHIKRTQRYLKALALHIKDKPSYIEYFEEDTVDMLFKSAPLHDVGKVAVADSILLKPGKLTFEEFEEMKKHPEYGRQAIHAARDELGDSSFLLYAEEIAYSHHEKWDGTGYPLGLTGDNIPVSGRMMAIVDVYDALISKRVYKPAYSHETAREIIIEGKGKHFDPELVEAFLDLEEVFIGISKDFLD